MSTRTELKSRAKASLSRYYWWAVLACFLAGILGGGNNSPIRFNVGGTQSVPLGQALQLSGNHDESGLGILLVALSVIAVFLVIFAVMFVLGMLWASFVGNPVRVGSCAFFMESRDQAQAAGVGRLFWAFESGRYKNVVMVMFMRWLYTFLWSLLLIIPGIIKGYEYYLVPYILHDNPGMHYKDALQISSDMMNGNKWRLFVLDLSFIGWEILALMCCGVGFIFLTPYIEATHAEFYADIRSHYWGQTNTNQDSYGY
ncbi:MAG: DUF975 family protein [Brotaphodocola sp.]